MQWVKVENKSFEAMYHRIMNGKGLKVYKISKLFIFIESPHIATMPIEENMLLMFDKTANLAQGLLQENSRIKLLQRNKEVENTEKTKEIE